METATRSAISTAAYHRLALRVDVSIHLPQARARGTPTAVANCFSQIHTLTNRYLLHLALATPLEDVSEEVVEWICEATRYLRNTVQTEHSLFLSLILPLSSAGKWLEALQKHLQEEVREDHSLWDLIIFDAQDDWNSEYISQINAAQEKFLVNSTVETPEIESSPPNSRIPQAWKTHRLDISTTPKICKLAPSQRPVRWAVLNLGSHNEVAAFFERDIIKTCLPVVAVGFVLGTLATFSSQKALEDDSLVSDSMVSGSQLEEESESHMKNSRELLQSTIEDSQETLTIPSRSLHADDSIEDFEEMSNENAVDVRSLTVELIAEQNATLLVILSTNFLSKCERNEMLKSIAVKYNVKVTVLLIRIYQQWGGMVFLEYPRSQPELQWLLSDVLRLAHPFSHRREHVSPTTIFTLSITDEDVEVIREASANIEEVTERTLVSNVTSRPQFVPFGI